MSKKKRSAKRSAKKSASLRLKADIERELMRTTYQFRKFREVKFISRSSITDLYGSGAPTKLQLSLQDDIEYVKREEPKLPIESMKIADLKHFVLDSALKLHALLILIGQSWRIIPIFLEAHPTTDHIFEQQNTHDTHYCSVEFLKTKPHLGDIADALARKQWIIPPVLCREITPKFPRHSFRFPFEQYLGNEGGGSGGEVYRVKSMVLAHKEVELRNDETTRMQEVHSIRARRHPNVVEFYASFIAGQEDPSQENDPVDYLHMLFEHADGGNMKKWLTQVTTPGNLVDDLKRGNMILRCAQDLVNAVTFIHSKIEKYNCSHHDIKPKNIVLFSGPPPIWKLCDFGMANLKHHKDDSGTGPARYGGLGTYEYQPPEYRSEPSHGRSFDVYSLGCVFLELATVWAYGWNDNKLGEFRDLRGKNEQNMDTPTYSPDYSYHNNPNVVESWNQYLRQEGPNHECFKQFLSLTADMMKPRPRRIFIWEANMDLFELAHLSNMVEKRSERPEGYLTARSQSAERRLERLLEDHFRTIVQPPKTPVNGLSNSRNPLQRARKRGKHWQLKILQDNYWSDEKPQTSSLAKDQEEHFSTLETCPKNDEYESNDLFGRHQFDKEISKMFDKRSCVGLYGTSGVGKSHLAYNYINRFRKAEVFTERKHTFWLEAGTEARLRSTLLKVIERVKLTLTEMEDPFVAMSRWLSLSSNGSWIMVVDGLDSIPIARLVKMLLPKDVGKDVGKILITTNCRDTLDELTLCRYESCILVDGLELEARRQLFQSYYRDVLTSTADMDSILQQYSLPILIKLVASYLHKSGISPATWYKEMRSGDGIKNLEHILKDDPQDLRLLLPLVADIPYNSNSETDYRQYREFPSAPLKLLAELSCLDNSEIDLALLQQNYEKRETVGKLWDMLGFLKNCNFIGKAKPKGKPGNSHCYFMHETIQGLVRSWVTNSMGRRTLLQLHETALCLLLAQYLFDKKLSGTHRSTYLLKLPFMPHFERFSQFVQSCEGDNPFPGYECSDNMVQSVITFIHVYLDEGRYNDAVCIMDFMRKLYAKGLKFKPHLARLLAKAYILPPLPRERNTGWNQAAEFLEEVIQECANQRKDQQQKWLCLLELIELYCRSMRPKEAAKVLSSFREISLQTDRSTKRARLRIHNKEAYLGPEAELDVAEISIRKKIAEARVHLTWAKFPALFRSRPRELEKSRIALDDAKLAIKFLFSGNETWIAEVDESIADVLLEFDNMSLIQEALDIYERISELARTDLKKPPPTTERPDTGSGPTQTDLGTTSTTTKRADKDKRKWRIDCKIARAKLRLGAKSRPTAVDLLTQTISSYEAFYGKRDGKHNEHTRACAYLLHDAYMKAEGTGKAQHTKDLYHLMIRGNDYVPYPDVKIGNDFFDCIRSPLCYQIFTCLVVLSSAMVFFYSSRY
ncbi:uncharacterized protein N0V89_011162 [Didymosphaeria variabile]|uniref:Protein kinase domain-containing protein n=1 Tax=Didymosphaeria variabile TaxID=1932322 RepID=A0A9W8XCZ7_9PLEO|nr:uncharacterized protein N0V89_011162 [Didymosphaeria variabile]KAJ4347223.1 hypothetical protein N0V89_011162 [Didymosphaeria variabile]